ncbi:hypothetical protein [Ekhidna sp.]
MSKIAIYSLIVFIISCSSCTDNSEVTENFQLGDIEILIDDLFENGVVLGNLDNSKSLNEAFKNLYLEIDLMKEENNEIEEVVVFIINNENNIVLEGYQAISKTNEVLIFEHVNKSKGARILEPIPAAGCPSGYEDLGSCSNLEIHPVVLEI